MTVQVSSVRVSGSITTVYFQDGHRVIFAENKGGLTSLERIWLERDDQIIAMFHSAYQYPVNYQPFGIVQLAPGYTVERAAKYWRAAYDYVAAKFRDGELDDAWLIIHSGGRDIGELSAGDWPAP